MKNEHHQHSKGTETVSDSVLLWTVLANLGLSVFEFIAGLVSGSVSLMADALHNTNDAGALLIAYIARKISHKGADERYTFGYKRAQLIGAMIQLTALILIGLFLTYEAIRRFFVPEPLQGAWIMAAAGIALIVDIVTAWLLWAMSKGSLNLKAAFLHNLTDAGASVAVLLGGAAIYYLGWNWVDPVVTLLIAAYILWMSWGLLIQTSSILMEGTPKGIDIAAVQEAIEDCEGVVEAHHIHLWELDEDRRALEAHVVVSVDSSIEEAEALKQQIKHRLQEEFSIVHSTLEFEIAGTDCESCK